MTNTRFSALLLSGLILSLAMAGFGCGATSTETFDSGADVTTSTPDPDLGSSDPDFGSSDPDLAVESSDGAPPSTGTLRVLVSAPHLCSGRRVTCDGWLYVGANKGGVLSAPAIAEARQAADLTDGKAVTVTLTDVPAGTMYVIAIFRTSGPIGDPSITGGDMATGFSKITLGAGQSLDVPRVIDHQFEDCFGSWVDQGRDCRSPTDEIYPTSCCEGLLCGGLTNTQCAQGLICQDDSCVPE